MEAPIKCQVCPYFVKDMFSNKYKCSCAWCALQSDDKLRKQVYKAIKNLGDK